MGRRVVVTDHAFGHVRREENVARAHAASFDCYGCTDESGTAEALDGADVALVNFAPVSRGVLERMAPGGTVIRYGIGYDNVDVDAARDLGISVANVPDYGTETVADHAAASLLAVMRRIPEYDRRVRAEGWLKPTEVGVVRGFRSTVVGLVGLGRTARATHARLLPFGFSFVGADPHCPHDIFDELGVERVDVADLAERAHAVSLHAPHTRETHRMIDADFLGRMQPGSVLVNTARGSLIDETALTDAIESGQVAAAALDVTDPEPIPTDSPLRQLGNVVLTPHAAFYDEDSLAKLQELASDEAGRALRDEPLRCRIV